MKSIKNLLLPFFILTIYQVAIAQESIEESIVDINALPSEENDRYNARLNDKRTKSVKFVKLKNFNNIHKKKKFSFNLPDYTHKLTARLDLLMEHSESSFDWTGTVYDKDDNHIGSIVINVERDMVWGVIHINDQEYTIEDIGKDKSNNRLNIYVQKDMEQLRKKGCDVDEEHQSSDKISTTQKVSCNQKDIRLVVMYTHNARLTGIDAYQAARSGISTTNKAFEYTVDGARNNYRFVLAGSVYLSKYFIESNNIRSDLSKLSSINYINQKRDQYQADIIVVYTQNNSYEYDGWATIGANSVNNAFAIVNITTNQLFPHEVGHILGGQHYKSYKATKYRDGATFVIEYEKYTIMTSWGGDIPFYSNPNFYFDGISYGTSTKNNNATLKSYACPVSNIYDDRNKSNYKSGLSIIYTYSETLYPNPATDIIQLPHGDTAYTDAHIMIYNSQGQQVYRGPYEGPAIQISHLDKGAYILRIFSSDVAKQYQFIKAN